MTERASVWPEARERLRLGRCACLAGVAKPDPSPERTSGTARRTPRACRDREVVRCVVRSSFRAPCWRFWYLVSARPARLAQDATPRPIRSSRSGQGTYAFSASGYVSLIVVTDEGVIVTEPGSQFDTTRADRLKAAVAGLTDQPVRTWSIAMTIPTTRPAARSSPIPPSSCPTSRPWTRSPRAARRHPGTRPRVRRPADAGAGWPDGGAVSRRPQPLRQQHRGARPGRASPARCRLHPGRLAAVQDPARLISRGVDRVAPLGGGQPRLRHARARPSTGYGDQGRGGRGPRLPRGAHRIGPGRPGHPVSPTARQRWSTRSAPTSSPPTARGRTSRLGFPRTSRGCWPPGPTLRVPGTGQRGAVDLHPQMGDKTIRRRPPGGCARSPVRTSQGFRRTLGA